MRITRIQLRRGTEEQWEDANPILESGEVGVVIEPGIPAKFKIGDGATPWETLAFGGGPQGPKGLKGDNFTVEAAGPLAERDSQTVNSYLATDTGHLYIKGTNGWSNPIPFVGPQGPRGPKGDNFVVNASGLLSGRNAYDGTSVGFAYLATDTGHVYFKTETGWSSAVPFVGPPGPRGPEGPAGEPGPKGDGFNVNATGNLSDRNSYSGEAKGFSFLAADTGDLYIMGNTGWSEGIPFKGPKGDPGPKGDVGPKGDPGPKGDAGPKGDVGPQGPAGDTNTSGLMPKAGGEFTGEVTFQSKLVNPELKNYTESVTRHDGVSGAVTINLNDSNVHVITPSGNITGITVTGVKANVLQLLTIIVVHGATPRSVVWFSGISWRAPGVPTLSSANKTTIVDLVSHNGGTTWLGGFSEY